MRKRGGHLIVTKASDKLRRSHADRHRFPMAAKKQPGGRMPWWELSLIGVGSIIGAGFFLGTGLSIRIAGPGVLILYLAGGLTAMLLFLALAEMTVRDPEPGSFRAYARQAFGPRAGFMSGWIYWTAGVLIMSSEDTALSIFARFWFPSVPLWVFAAGFALAGLGIVMLGVKNFGTVESFFGVLKIATLSGFILAALLFLFGGFGGQPAGGGRLGNWAGAGAPAYWLPNGWTGLLSAFIFVLFSYGGVEVIGVMAMELKRKSDAPKSGTRALLALTAMYIGSLALILSLAAWRQISEKTSPFVTALSAFPIPYLDSALNAILISAAFSTMVGAMFGITSILVNLAADGSAPKALKKLNRRGVPVRALGLGATGLAAGAVLSFLLPSRVYEYLTTSAGVIEILNWILILSTQLRLRRVSASANPDPAPPHEQSGAQAPPRPVAADSPARLRRPPFRMPFHPWSSFLGIALILMGVAGACLQAGQRIGVYVGLAILAVIGAASLLVRNRD